MNKALTKKEEAALENVAVVPSYIETDVEQEQVAPEDVIIPRLELVQPMSPVKDEDDESRYIQGASDGQIYNTVTRELYGAGIRVIPILFRKEFLVFIPRDAGGGFRGSFGDAAEAKAHQAELDEETELIDAGVHYCLMGTAGNPLEQVAIVCTKTKMKVSRQWNTMVVMSKLERFARAYQLTAVKEENKKGKYYNFKVTPMGWPTEEEYTIAKIMAEGFGVTQPKTVYEDENLQAANQDF